MEAFRLYNYIIHVVAISLMSTLIAHTSAKAIMITQNIEPTPKLKLHFSVTV